MPPESHPICEVTYTAMRASFVVTLDSLLRCSLDPAAAAENSFGFFGCYPMLNSTSPQIQLECLLRTWQRCFQNGESPDLLDECVFYASYDALAEVCCGGSGQTLKVILNGPHPMDRLTEDHWLHSKTRCLQTASKPESTDAILGQLAEIRDPSPWFGGSETRSAEESSEELLDLVGRWRADKNVIFGTSGLLTNDEQDILRAFFEEHPGLVR